MAKAYGYGLAILWLYVIAGIVFSYVLAPDALDTTRDLRIGFRRD